MKKGIIFPVGRITVVPTKEGESIEQTIRKMIAGNEPIKATANLQYHERKDGVMPEHDIRSDRFMYAMMAADKVHASSFAKRMEQDGFKQNEDGTWSLKEVTVDPTKAGQA